MSKLAKLPPQPIRGSNYRGVERVNGSFVLGSSGVVSSYAGPGVVVTKVAATTGRYLVTLAKGYRALVGYTVEIQGATSAAINAKGIDGHDPGDFDTGATFLIETESALGTEADLSAGTVWFELVYSQLA
jgi:hypothetical protein